mmetsp:Transcript_39458/g.85088  ORF Transcript_39458/g.85088 Transcript_39458/m.85088 type:complete len:326 (-) Transcript_39458:132-1109(-)
MILLPYRLHQNLQRLHLPLRQQPKLRTKEHKMLKTRIQMRRHLQRLQRPKETTVNNPVHPKKPPKNLPAKRRKLRRLKNPQRLRLVVIVRKLGLVINLIGDPLQHLLDVHGSAHADRRGVPAAPLAPPVFHPGRKPLPGTKAVEVGILGHDGPYGGDVVVEVDGVDGDPSGAGFALGEGDGVVEGAAGAEGLFGVAVESIAEGSGAVTEGLECSCSGGEGGSCRCHYFGFGFVVFVVEVMVSYAGLRLIRIDLCYAEPIFLYFCSTNEFTRPNTFYFNVVSFPVRRSEISIMIVVSMLAFSVSVPVSAKRGRTARREETRSKMRL